MYSYIPSGVCSKKITFDIVDGKVHNVKFEGGCNGNGKGVSILSEGRNINEVIQLLADVECKDRGTSCPAQLAKALRQAEDGSIIPESEQMEETSNDSK
ncbi:MAG: TIGR03905 family TSCPD domain-containing protein [Lawsonibacter sp.]|nr:TIGR03905 family TSCPD domain-containing protein [Lawsonibacter sp.]